MKYNKSIAENDRNKTLHQNIMRLNMSSMKAQYLTWEFWKHPKTSMDHKKSPKRKTDIPPRHEESTVIEAGINRVSEAITIRTP